MQNKIKINDVEIYQPDKDLSYKFETTYTEGSTRTQGGTGKFTPMFTVEQLGYTATGIPAAEASKILKMVVGKQFQLYYYSVYHGKWRTDTFYVGQGDLVIRTLENKQERVNLSFNMTGVNKL